MKGYYTDIGYMGWIPNRNEYQLFPTETEYVEQYTEDGE